MMYVIQAAVFFGVMYLGIHYDWTPNGLLLGCVAWTAALIVTCALVELKKLAAWIAHRSAGLTGLQDQPAHEITRLPRTLRHSGDALENRPARRIGQNPR
jgi:hypothetical protein